MLLKSLLLPNEIELRAPSAAAESLSVAGITADSRSVKPGYIFAAFPPDKNRLANKQSGLNYIADAMQKGAAAILAARADKTKIDSAISPPILLAEDARIAYAKIAAKFFPGRPEKLLAITGTNGKTSSSVFARHLWRQLGQKSASMGTIGVIGPDFKWEASLTTADATVFHQNLDKLAKAGITRAAFEASSHGLAQGRIHGVQVEAAAFTNFTQDHLDYHPSMEEYFRAKMILFQDILKSGGTAVLNKDIPEYEKLAAIVKKRQLRIISYGKKNADIEIKNVMPQAQGQMLNLKVFGENFDVLLPLLGGFQVWNAMAALGSVIATDNRIQETVAGLGALPNVPGRMELVAQHPKGAPIFVDYAHTPDALQNVLRYARGLTSGKLWAVFGCGGDRDPSKRPLMGRIAGQLADKVIVTDDNPRSEEPAAIRAAILKECKGAEEIGDRRLAIETAVKNLSKGDVLIIAGKGHEQGQIIKGQIFPFDDAKVACQAVQQLGEAA
ncbi:MAG: UDP-N-acetylmuramoyl-L-alanyl-D-glutamate--2,6-diaminopimelate ligase [Dongiaceae bacterium]